MKLNYPPYIEQASAACVQELLTTVNNGECAVGQSWESIIEKYIYSVLVHHAITEECSEVGRIMAVVAKVFNVPIKDLKNGRKTQPLAFARQVAMTEIRRRLDMSLTTVGNLFNVRDHGTVMWATNKVDETMKSEDKRDDFRKDRVNKVKKILDK